MSDVDAVQDRMLRLRSPWIIAIASSVVTVALVAVIDLRSGLVLAASTGAAMATVRGVVPWSVRRSGDRSSQWRGEAVAVCAAWSAGLPPVLFGVVVLAPLALMEPLSALADAEGLRPGIEAAEGRLRELADAPTSIADPPTRAPLPSTFDREVADLAIGWGSTLVSGIRLALDEGEVLAVAGPSGSGKSTLAVTLARLIEPRGGSIRLGGRDVCTLGAPDVRSVIGYLGQDEIVFDTTIRENLRIAGPSATDDEMLASLGLAGLADFVRSLPDGLETTVGERGNRLSGGERQRLCLARLVLSGHRILVLDEPTEHLDEEAAESLLDDVLSLAPERSFVVISHSPRVLDRIGRVMTLGEGATAETPTSVHG